MISALWPSLELDFGDARAALFDLLRRDHDLADVLVGLVEMALQLEHAVVHARHVLDQPADLGLDLAGGLAHALLFLHLLHEVDADHEQRRRDDDDLGAERLLDDVVESFLQIGVERFRRHEHQRDVLGFAGDQIFVGDVAQVLGHVGAHPRGRLLALVVGLGFLIGGDGFEREFGVDDQRALPGQEHRAVRPHLVG